ncbi:hypothetical protein HMPREF1556_01219 [Porphyromonas sp. oral taxon 278 str. W7784]|nr:hypothetical protein HMPREF1556_01219 [Porphyromonas sp. oral taxon 278 str. W7784]
MSRTASDPPFFPLSPAVLRPSLRSDRSANFSPSLRLLQPKRTRFLSRTYRLVHKPRTRRRTIYLALRLVRI